MLGTIELEVMQIGSLVHFGGRLHTLLDLGIFTLQTLVPPLASLWGSEKHTTHSSRWCSLRSQSLVHSVSVKKSVNSVCTCYSVSFFCNFCFCCINPSVKHVEPTEATTNKCTTDLHHIRYSG